MNGLKIIIAGNTFTAMILFFLLFFIYDCLSKSEPDTLDKGKRLLERREFEKHIPADYPAKDSISVMPLSDEDKFKSSIPTGYVPNIIQDSIYKMALELKIPASVRFQNDLNRFAESKAFYSEIEKGTPWQIAMENLMLKPEIFAPTGIDKVRRQEMIDNAFYIPFVPNRISSGYSISPQELGVFLGLLEDVSPVIKFDLNYTEEVEIVIYSVQATVIATVFKGILPAGNHKFVWNLRDDKGRPMPQGDYIAEVRIGNSRFIRKRIQIP